MSLVLVLVAAASAAVPATMTAVRVRGGPCKTPFACVQKINLTTPHPGFGEVLVKLASSSVNPSDLDAEGTIGNADPLGVDFAGTVVALGKGVKKLKLGEFVWGYTIGAYSEYALAFEATTAPGSSHCVGQYRSRRSAGEKSRRAGRRSPP